MNTSVQLSWPPLDNPIASATAIDRRPQYKGICQHSTKSNQPKFKHITEQNSPSGPRLRCGTHSRARLPRGTGPCGAPGHNPPGGGGGGGEAAVGPSFGLLGGIRRFELIASYSGMGCEKWHVPPGSAIDFEGKRPTETHVKSKR